MARSLLPCKQRDRAGKAIHANGERSRPGEVEPFAMPYRTGETAASKPVAFLARSLLPCKQREQIRYGRCPVSPRRSGRWRDACPHCKRRDSAGL